MSITIHQTTNTRRQPIPSLRAHCRLPRRPTIRGNQYWKRRTRHGRRLKYQTPDQLLAACETYFQWVDNNPLHGVRLFFYRGKAHEAKIAKHRPMTRTGLYRHLKIDRRTWRNYRDREDFFPVCERVEMVIYEQLFSLAAAGLINPRFIAPYLSKNHGKDRAR